MSNMNNNNESPINQRGLSGLLCLCSIAAYYRIAADPVIIKNELALLNDEINEEDILRGAKSIGLKTKLITKLNFERFKSLPAPAIVSRKDKRFIIFVGRTESGKYRIADPVDRINKDLDYDELATLIEPKIILLARRLGGPGVHPKAFDFYWFLPTFWRYRKPFGQVLIASLFVQIFALVTPLFFQVVIDKVLTHRGYSTLFVLVAGLAIIGLFDVILQYLRTYTLSHTTNRIDVELGRKLFHHFLRLPISYSETRSAGQTVARLRELETIRGFLSERGLFAALDLFFSIVFIVVLFTYSWKLTLIVLTTIPLYIIISWIFRPLLLDMVKQKFNKGAESQQFLVETIVGIQTIKAAAVEPIIQAQWEEKLAAYVSSAFQAGLLSAKGQGAIQYVSKLSSAALLLFGAKAVLDGDLTVGELVAFNMIAGQVSQPILRLSQIFQDFQQVQVSVERLGDILNSPSEPVPEMKVALPPPKGDIEFKNVTFRYRQESPDVLKNVSISIKQGDVVGIVGPSGSGKSTLTKLIQRFYMPHEGHVYIDGSDLSQVDPAWLRRNIGVVLQENLLFNRTIHENIALGDPALSRAKVIAISRLAGADEFIVKLPRGYDTMIEERGANLSGGQRQRIAIARALATNPPILIFDEATSALDYVSESLIQQNMAHIVKNRTVIIIAHRLAAVRPCNKIIGMVDGRVVEEGSHEDLIKRDNGIYSKLWKIQSGGEPK